MSGVRLQGCQATIFLVTQSDITSLQCFRQGLERFVDSCQSGLAGLQTCYSAVVTTNRVKKKIASQTKHKLGVGRWQCVTSSGLQTPTGRRRQQAGLLSSSSGGGGGGQRLSLAALERTLAALIDLEAAAGSLGGGGGGGGGAEGDDDGGTLADAASRLHTLLDKPPWSSHAHVVMDVHWFTGAERPPPPSTAIALFGALLRAACWHHACLDIVTSAAEMMEGGAHWKEAMEGGAHWKEAMEGGAHWKEAMEGGGVSVTSLDDWRPLRGVVWRGAVHFTEHKIPKQAAHQRVAFLGFTLALALSSSSSPSSEHCFILSDSEEELLAGVGLRSHDRTPGTGHTHPVEQRFSHLELLEVVDTSSLPLFWLSPLHCSLSLNSAASPASVKLFNRLFTSHSNQSSGLLLCLCYSEHRADPNAATHRSHSDWLACLQDNEELCPAPDAAPFPLAAYDTGPLLLVCPSGDQSDSSMQSCDAWFLWRPEAVDAGVFARLKQSNMLIAEDQGDWCEELLSGLSFEAIASQTDPVRQLLGSALAAVALGNDGSGGEGLVVLQTEEWLQRKMVHRITTPELMFGVMVAPPPVSMTTDAVTAGDILSCFSEAGSPTAGELSPIAMRDPSAAARVHVPIDADASYGSIVASTPTSKKKYHGISYCLSQEDSAYDKKLTRIQQSCLAHERHSTCSSANSPRAPPHPRPRYPQLSEMKSPVVKLTRVKEAGAGRRRRRGGRGTRGRVAKLKHMKLEITPSKVLTRTDPSSYSEPVDQAATLSPVAPSASCELKQHTATIDPLAATDGDLLSDQPLERSLPHSPATERGGEEEAGASRSIGTQSKPRKEKKKLLEDVVLVALRSNGMRRSHACFRNCYRRLYHVSKSYLKDLKAAADTSMMQEFEKVVKFNVRQVIEFELRITGKPSIG